LRGQAFTEALGHIARFAEGLSNQAAIALGVLVPIRHATGRIDANDPRGTDAQLFELGSDTASFENLLHEFLSIFRAAYGRTAARRRPDRCHYGADDESFAADLVRHSFEGVVAA